MALKPGLYTDGIVKDLRVGVMAWAAPHVLEIDADGTAWLDQYGTVTAANRNSVDWRPDNLSGGRYLHIERTSAGYWITCDPLRREFAQPVQTRPRKWQQKHYIDMTPFGGPMHGVWVSERHIREMDVGESGYTVPWALVISKNLKGELRPDMIVQPSIQGSVSMRVTRLDDCFWLEPPSGGHTWVVPNSIRGPMDVDTSRMPRKATLMACSCNSCEATPAPKPRTVTDAGRILQLRQLADETNIPRLHDEYLTEARRLWRRTKGSTPYPWKDELVLPATDGQVALIEAVNQVAAKIEEAKAEPAPDPILDLRRQLLDAPAEEPASENPLDFLAEEDRTFLKTNHADLSFLKSYELPESPKAPPARPGTRLQELERMAPMLLHQTKHDPDDLVQFKRGVSPMTRARAFKDTYSPASAFDVHGLAQIYERRDKLWTMRRKRRWKVARWVGLAGAAAFFVWTISIIPGPSVHDIQQQQVQTAALCSLYSTELAAPRPAGMTPEQVAAIAEIQSTYEKVCS